MGLEGRSVVRSVVEFRCGLVWIYKRDVDVVVVGGRHAWCRGIVCAVFVLVMFSERVVYF